MSKQSVFRLVRLSAIFAEKWLEIAMSYHVIGQIVPRSCSMRADRALEWLDSFVNPHVFLQIGVRAVEQTIAVWALVTLASHIAMRPSAQPGHLRIETGRHRLSISRTSSKNHKKISHLVCVFLADFGMICNEMFPQLLLGLKFLVAYFAFGARIGMPLFVFPQSGVGIENGWTKLARERFLLVHDLFVSSEVFLMEITN